MAEVSAIMKGSVIYLIVAAVVVVIVVIVLLLWTSYQLRKVGASKMEDRDARVSATGEKLGRKGRAARRAVSDQIEVSSAGQAEQSAAQNAEVNAVQIEEHSAVQSAVQSAVRIEEPSPERIAEHNTAQEPDQSGFLWEHNSRIQMMLQELEQSVAGMRSDTQGLLAEQVPPFVLEQEDAEDSLSLLGEDEIVRLSAYEARLNEEDRESPPDDASDQASDQADSVSTMEEYPPREAKQTLQGYDGRIVNLPVWLHDRLQQSIVLGWLVVFSDGACAASDQIYDDVVIERFAELVKVAVQTAETVGLERTAELTLRGEDGAIALYPLSAYAIDDDAFLVVFFAETAVPENWLRHTESDDTATHDSSVV